MTSGLYSGPLYDEVLYDDGGIPDVTAPTLQSYTAVSWEKLRRTPQYEQSPNLLPTLLTSVVTPIVGTRMLTMPPLGRIPPTPGIAASFPLPLRGQDTFYGAPGEAPTHDWQLPPPAPRRLRPDQVGGNQLLIVPVLPLPPGKSTIPERAPGYPPRFVPGFTETRSYPIFPVDSPIHCMGVFVQTTIQGTVLATPLTSPTAAPLRVEAITSTILGAGVVTDPNCD